MSIRSSRLYCAAAVVCCLASLLVVVSQAQTAKGHSSPRFSRKAKAGGQNPFSPQSGEVDLSHSVQQTTPTVSREVNHDLSPPLYLIPPAVRQGGQRVHDIEILPRPNVASVVDSVVQRTGPTRRAPATLLNFAGVGNGFTGPAGTFFVGSAPPDTNGDVGPNHYVQIVNTDFAIFNKSGTAVFGPTPINTLWSGFGGGCQSNNDGDPVVIYDPIADRWVISQFSVSTLPYLQCVAVSKTGDPTGAYYRYSFPSAIPADFPDYPKMSVWPDAYYETFNMFAGGVTFSGGEVCAYERAKMLVGLGATQQCFNVGTNYGGLLASDLDGAQLPPAGSPNYVLALGLSNNDLAFWKFHVDWANPAKTTLTGPAAITVAAYNALCGGGTCVSQSGTTQKLDSLADRLMFRLSYRNFGTHESLLVNHSVAVGAGGGVRWYEIRTPGTTPTVFQQGTYAPDSSFRWMGSMAMDQSGNIALGFSTSSSSLHPQIRYTGRLAGDPAGQMTQGEGTIASGAGSQNGGLTRWGDYSMMAVDPADDCTFWYTTEDIPANGSFNWVTRIASFKLPGCGVATNDFSISANPTTLSLAAGTGGSSTISTALLSGSAETINLSISGVPSGATAGFTPASVTTGSSSTLALNAGTAAAGTYPLSVTGTAASATHATPLTLIVTPAGQAPAITSANHTTFTVGQAGSFSVTTTGSPTPGISESGALPSGVTFHDNGNGTGTLGGTPGAGTNATYSISFTAANGVGSNAVQSFTLTVNPSATLPPTLTNISPASGVTGTSFGVTLTGTNFIVGLTTVKSTANGISVSNVNVASATQLTATFAIVATAVKTNSSISVTTPNGTSGGINFDIYHPPTLSSIAQNNGVAGTAVNVTLTGTFFRTPITVGLSGTGITVSNTVVQSATQITATFTIAANASVGPQNVTVNNPGGTSNAVTFTVNKAPAITSANTATFVVGTPGMFSLTATGFPTPSLSESGPLPSGVTFVDNHNGTGTLSGTPAAGTAGVYSISFTAANGVGSNAVQSFTLTVNAATQSPVLNNISPTSGQAGKVVTPVTLSGSNLTGATINPLNGIAISNVVATASQVTATFTIAANAPLGAQNVSVTTGSGTSNAVSFTVLAAGTPPTLTLLSPSRGPQGKGTNVTLTGTNFVTGQSTLNVTGASVVASNVIVVSSTKITATLTPAANATGTAQVSVTTPGGTSGAQSFDIYLRPTLTGISPMSGARGANVSVTLTGTNFRIPQDLGISGGGVKIVNIVIVNSTTLTVTFQITAGAATGIRTVFTFNPGGSTNTVNFTVN